MTVEVLEWICLTDSKVAPPLICIPEWERNMWNLGKSAKPALGKLHT
jgi:hypothetical protein